MPQFPELQAGVPFVELQTLPQAPQLPTSLVRRVSQPLPTLPSQFAKPGLQVIVQEPDGQPGVPFALLQTLPQAPQLLTVLVLTSQPFASSPSQFAKPGLQVIPEQAPPVQVGVPPLELHALPQLPQFWMVPRFVSQPLLATPSQLPQPELHWIPQVPAVQVGTPLVELQTFPQAPQLEGRPRFVSQPLLAAPSQFAYPALQVMPQDPAAQVGVPLVELQTTPQAPQWPVLLPRFVSQPLETSPSQLP